MGSIFSKAHLVVHVSLPIQQLSPFLGTAGSTNLLGFTNLSSCRLGSVLVSTRLVLRDFVQLLSFAGPEVTHFSDLCRSVPPSPGGGMQENGVEVNLVLFLGIGLFFFCLRGFWGAAAL